MRNQVNSMQKEAVLLTRHLAKLVMQLTGAADDELQEFDNYAEAVEVITQVRQAFINLDDAHMGDMDFEKYVQAFQFLHVNASQDEMRKSFDKIDTNNSGYIDESEFLASLKPLFRNLKASKKLSMMPRKKILTLIADSALWKND